MGSPKKQRKKYETPKHPWIRERIETERVITKEYGLKNKKEIWKMESKLRSFLRQARSLISKNTPQSKKEEKDLLNKLYKYSLIDENAKVENILSLTLKNIMDRRLQTLVYKKGLAKSIKQSRQMIVHGHIFVDSKKVNVPSYLMARDEENKINYSHLSNFTNPDHPERVNTRKKGTETKEEVIKSKNKKKVTKENA